MFRHPVLTRLIPVSYTAACFLPHPHVPLRLTPACCTAILAMGAIIFFLGFHVVKQPYSSPYLNNVDTVTLTTALVHACAFGCGGDTDLKQRGYRPLHIHEACICLGSISVANMSFRFTCFNIFNLWYTYLLLCFRLVAAPSTAYFMLVPAQARLKYSNLPPYVAAVRALLNHFSCALCCLCR